jgi:hypothetical protein
MRDHGAREIFGIPGDFVLPFFKVIEESGILPHYTLSHEPAVGFAADAAARYHCTSSNHRKTRAIRAQVFLASDREPVFKAWKPLGSTMRVPLWI